MVPDLLSAGSAYLDAGLNALPAYAAKKCPVGSWKKYQTVKNSDSGLFRGGDAICVVGGAVSGNLEIIDFDLKGELYAPAREKLTAEFGAEFVNRFLVERSPSGGYHLAYRCEERVEGNKKLALKCVKSGISGSTTCYYQKKSYQIQPDGAIYPVGIETRGEGGICLVAPSPNYEIVQGAWTDLPTVTAAERAKMLEIFRSFDESPAGASEPEKKGVSRLLTERPAGTAQLDPADWARENDYTTKILAKNGWTKVGETNDFEHWRRPGKSDGQSGSVFKDTRLFKCFSSNAAPLEADRCYTPIELMAAFCTGGDLSEAARRIRQVMPKQPAARPVPAETATKPRPKRSAAPRTTKTKAAFPESALKCGGMLGEIMDFTNSVSIKAQPVLAFAGALVAMSFCIARRVRTPGNVRPNVYCLGIAGAGTGKEAARRVCRMVHAEMSEFGASCPERYESKQALANHILHDGAVMACPDEFARYLKAITSRNAGNFLASILDEWLMLYSAANAAEYTPRICAVEAQKNEAKKVSQPHFCIYGTTNPDDFFDALNWNLISNGFVPRCLLFEGDPNPKRIERGMNGEISYAMPESLREHVRAWRDFRRPDMSAATKENNPPDPLIVRYTDDAAELASDFIRELDNANPPEKELREFYARAGENFQKIALILACSKYWPDPERLVIDEECVRIAIDVERWQLAQFRDWTRQYVAENDYESSVKKVSAWFASQQKDCVSLTEFTRRWSRFRRIEREDILDTLEAAGVIQRETSNGVTWIWILGLDEETALDKTAQKIAA